MTTFPRARPRHATANDEALDLAGVAVLAEVGWDAASVSGISASAGLTSGAFYARFPTLADMAEALWRGPSQKAFAAAVAQVTSDVTDPVTLTHALTAWADPSDHHLRAALELVQAAQIDLALSTTKADAHRIIHEALPHDDPPLSAQRAAALALAMGLALTSTRSRSTNVDITLTLPDWTRAIATPSQPRPLPPDRADHLRTYPFDTGDPRHDQTLIATLTVIGTYGYRHASIARICREANITSGYLYDRYSGKLDLFLAASRLYTDGSFERTLDYVQRMTTEHGPVVAEAVLWREYQMPDILTQQLVLMEMYRMAQFNERMGAIQDEQEDAFIASRTTGLAGTALARAQARWHAEIALGIGLNLLSIIGSATSTLPYDVVIEPLLAQGLLH